MICIGKSNTPSQIATAKGFIQYTRDLGSKESRDMVTFSDGDMAKFEDFAELVFDLNSELTFV